MCSTFTAGWSSRGRWVGSGYAEELRSPRLPRRSLWPVHLFHALVYADRVLFLRLLSPLLAKETLAPHLVDSVFEFCVAGGSFCIMKGLLTLDRRFRSHDSQTGCLLAMINGDVNKRILPGAL